MRVLILDTPDAVDRYASWLIREQLREKRDSAFCFAGGDTTKSIHRRIVEDLQGNRQAFSQARAFVLDEYYGVPSSDPRGVAGRLKAQILDQLFDEAAVSLFDSCAADTDEACRKYDEKWFSAGLDLAFLGLGKNGHLGFNEPGTSFASVSHLTVLSEQTRRSKAAVFGGYENVPTRGITVGIKNILSVRHLVLAVKGWEKQDIVRAALTGAVTEEVPASILREHPHVTVLLDRAAAAKLEGRAADG